MKHLIILTALFCIGIANAQQQKDVVYLKNGSVIKGTITEVNPGSNLKIETTDGSLFVFEMDEIERLSLPLLAKLLHLLLKRKSVSLRNPVQANQLMIPIKPH